MSDNKFILQLKGTQTPKSVVEIKNDQLVAPFTGVPHSTDVVGSIIDDKDSSVVVAKGAQNWKLDGSSLVVASPLSGDGAGYTGEFNVSGSGLWINATYSLPATIFSAGTKWALKLCGKNLLTTSGQTIGFTLVVKIGNTHITSKTFTVAEGANVFCRQLVIDFSESEQATIKAQSGDSLTVQLLCSDTNASATIYNGMTVFTALQRRVDGDTVASDKKTFDEVVQDIDDIQSDIEDIQDDIEDIDNKIIIRSATIPTASASLIGKAYQYAGTTNGQYTHNYIYECVAGETTYTGIIGFDPTKIAFDYTKGNLADFFSDTTPNFSQITHGTFTYDIAGDIWTIVGKDANENVLFSNYKLYTEDLQDAGFVFINPPQDYADGEVIDFEVTFTPQPTTYAWVRVDVQPDRITQIQALQADITDIQALIPAQASSTNQLGDKNFINSSIATNTANFIGTFNSVAELNAYSGTKTNNDYAFVIGTDAAGNTTYNRYKYTTATTPASWIYEYTLNNSSFTAAQWATINSGGTAADVAKARSAVQPEDLGNGTITITQGGTPRGTFNVNQPGDTTIDLDASGTTTSQSIDAEIVGTLTVADNGDVSGFGNSNYLLFPGDLDMTGANSFEIGVAFTLKLDESVIYLLSENPVSVLSDKHLTFMTQSTGLRFDINDGSNYQTLEGTTRLLRNTKYYAKLTYDGTNYTLSLSTDGINYTTEATAVAQYIPGNITYEYLIGRASSLIEYLHLSDYYIKKNGILVWQGMDAPGLHQRVDINASNISASGKLNIIDIIMPDYARATDITLSTSQSYTATKPGYISFIGTSNGTIAINVNGVTMTQASWSNGKTFGDLVMVSTGDVVTISQTSGQAITVNQAKFIPCKGA